MKKHLVLILVLFTKGQLDFKELREPGNWMYPRYGGLATEPAVP